MPKQSTKHSNINQLYTYTEVREKLGIGPATLTSLVDKGIIKRVIPPGRKTGYYLKTDVDDYFEKMSLFARAYTSRIEGSYRVRMATEADIIGIIEQHHRVFGSTVSTPVADMKARFEKNPEMSFVAEVDGKIVGHLELMPLKESALTAMLNGSIRGRQIKPNDIETFDEEKQYNIFIMYLAVDQNEETSKKRMDAAMLMREAELFWEEMANKGRLIKGLFATSRTRDGIFILERMEFKQIPEFSDSKKKAYILEMATSKSAIAQKYRELLKSLNLPGFLTEGIIEGDSHADGKEFDDNIDDNTETNGGTR